MYIMDLIYQLYYISRIDFLFILKKFINIVNNLNNKNILSSYSNNPNDFLVNSKNKQIKYKYIFLYG